MADNPISKFSSAASAIGYIYQFRLALMLLLRAAEHPLCEEDLLGISIELFDDVEVRYGKDHFSLNQSKSHVDPGKTLTDSDPDIWKTIRVWIKALALGDRSAQITHCLFTTAEAPEESAAYFLRDGKTRDVTKAIAALDTVAIASDSDSLATAISEWKSLGPAEKKHLADSIYVLDGSPDATEIHEQIARLLFRHKTPDERHRMMQTLEGWWIDRVTSHLYAHQRRKQEDIIRWPEVRLRIDEIISQFGLDNLPNEYGQLNPEFPIKPETDSRLFVHQMRSIGLSRERIQFAIRDHWRAREQRSKWISDMRLLPNELRAYDQLLEEEWQYISDDNWTSFDIADPDKAKAAGLTVFREIERLQIRLRSFSEKFLTRGSYHILADHPARIGWHPKWKTESALWAENAEKTDGSAT